MSDFTPLALPDGMLFQTWERPLSFRRTFHVAQQHPNAADRNPGAEEAPWKTISKAARSLRPGDRVIIHEGVYREWVKPIRSGKSADEMISYEAAPTGSVVLKGSDLWTPKWKRLGRKAPGIYATKLSPRMFEGANVFCLQNHPLHPQMKSWGELQPSYELRRGQLFLDGNPLTQVNDLSMLGQTENAFFVEENGMTIYLRLAGDASPQSSTFEITTREQVFAPEKIGLSYIRVKGLHVFHAANGVPVPHWQRGALSANGGHHWIIEDCEVGHANTIGIDLGARPGNEKITPHGWQVVRRCHVHHCGVAGVCAWPNEANQSFLIEDNLIADNAWMPIGAHFESAGIKLHYLLNSLIRRNVFLRNRSCGALWLDWLITNSRVTQNLFSDTAGSFGACFLEINHGPNLVDNNIILNSDRDGFYEHDVARALLLNNLIAGGKSIAVHLKLGDEKRTLRGKHPDGEHRVFGNILAGFETYLVASNETVQTDFNVLGGLKPSQGPDPFGFSFRDGYKLDAWRALGKDEHSIELPLTVEFDEKKLELRVTAGAGAKLPEFPELPAFFEGELPPFDQRVEHRLPPGLNPGSRVAAPEEMLMHDFFGRRRESGKFIPGPILDLPLDGRPLSVDPRK